MTPILAPVWKKSNAHLELLSKFIKVESPERYTQGDWGTEWKKVLKESPAKAIERFIKENYIVRPDLSTSLDYKFKVTELKNLCKAKGLPISGNKLDLIERLINVDEKGMIKETSNLVIFTCSLSGKSLIDGYFDAKKREKDNAEALILSALKKRDFKLASKLKINYEENQVFVKEENANWKKEKEKKYLSILSYMFLETPKILGDIPKDKLEPLRIIAGRDYLWGEPNPNLLEKIDRVSGKFDNQTCVKMLISYAENKEDLSEFIELTHHNVRIGWGVYYVEITSGDEDFHCVACRKLAKKIYPLPGKIPELPHPECTHESGCLCTYSCGTTSTEDYKKLGR